MSKEIQISESRPAGGAIAQQSVFCGDITVFENAQRIAGALSKSSIVPVDYQNNVANCMLAMEMAQRINANPMAVMQNLYIIHGRPSWSSQFVIAALNGCGRFSPIRFEMIGGPADEDKWGCRAFATEIESGDVVHGPWVSIKMAKLEGWYGKKGSKWKTMPDLMLRYRSAKFFGNLYAPDLLMGMTTDDESQDISRRPSATQERDMSKLKGFDPAKSEPEEKVITVEAELVEPEQEFKQEEF